MTKGVAKARQRLLLLELQPQLREYVRLLGLLGFHEAPQTAPQP